ncbi:enhancer of polycomb-like transcription factor protein [Wolffia australiana]
MENRRDKHACKRSSRVSATLDLPTLQEQKSRPTKENNFPRGHSRKGRRNSSTPSIISSDVRGGGANSNISIISELDSSADKSLNLSDSKVFSINVADDLKNAADKSKLCAYGRDPITLGIGLNVPRRPRGVLKRRNSTAISKQSPELLKSKHGSNFQKDLSVPRSRSGRKKKKLEEKENGSGQWNSSEHSKPINDFSLLKTFKKAKRSHRPCEKTDRSWGCEEEDEEKLEQNAAEMLSSRFDPRCADDSPGKSLPSSSSSLNGADHQRLVKKGCVKKERHFYEVCTRAVDPYWILKRRISIFWSKDQIWYLGLVKDYNPITKLHYVKYDDRDEEWIDLQDEKFKLLLLPSEFMSKFCGGKLRCNVKDENMLDDNCSTSELESEPIISWLSRSTNRLKALSNGIFKYKSKACREKNLPEFLVENGNGIENAAEFPKQKNRVNCNDHLECTRVYIRRRPGKKGEILENKQKENGILFDFSCSKNFFLLSGFSPLHKKTTDISLEQNINLRKFMLRSPRCSEYIWMQKDFLLYHHRKILPLWPAVLMEIVFLDNKLGLRFLSLRGQLLDAVKVLCLFLTMFDQLSRCDKLTMQKFPSTSVGLKISNVQGKGRPLFFCMYKFFSTDSSRWSYLDRKLKELCVDIKVLPVSASTYGNLMDLFCTSGVKSYCKKEEKSLWEGYARHSWMGDQRESCQFSISFDRMSALLLFLHFKRLEKIGTSLKSPEMTDKTKLCERSLSSSIAGNCSDPIFPAKSVGQNQWNISNDVYESLISPNSLRPHGKRQHHKRKRSNFEKDSDFVSGSSLKKSFDLVSCKANILVVSGDRGWREHDADIVLDSDNNKEWLVTVKVSSMRRYFYKAHQPLQPGATNRFTHAMMWKGGKDWTLEFPDRKEWSVFKEIYQECCDLNLRAASVRHIPIPGVSFVEDYDALASEILPFVRTSCYFREIGTDLDMALDQSRVVYDLDCEDEEWISEFRNSGSGIGVAFDGLSEEMVEKAMDRLEKEAFLQQGVEFTEAEIQVLAGEDMPAELFKFIYEHWLWRRRRKGVPLIRQFQPPLWEQYQQQLKEWESAKSTCLSSSNEVNNSKPPMFAFCLRPRRLELPNKYAKQRSHKKLSFGGHSFQGKRMNRPSLPSDHCERSYSKGRAKGEPAAHQKLSAAQRLSSIARSKRERAHWLVRRADVAVHRAVAILMTAEAMMGLGEEDGSETESSDLGGAAARGSSGVAFDDGASSNSIRHGCSSSDEEGSS